MSSGNDCGTVGESLSSNASERQFESIHRHYLLDKILKKRPRMCCFRFNNCKLTAVWTDAGVGRNWCRTPRALKCLWRGLDVLVVVCVLDHQIARDNRQREFNFDVRLSGGQWHLLGLVPHRGLVLQLDNSLENQIHYKIQQTGFKNTFGRPLWQIFKDLKYLSRTAAFFSLLKTV